MTLIRGGWQEFEAEDIAHLFDIDNDNDWYRVYKNQAEFIASNQIGEYEDADEYYAEAIEATNSRPNDRFALRNAFAYFDDHIERQAIDYLEDNKIKNVCILEVEEA